jgi:Flp pilus assembly protein TadG
MSTRALRRLGEEIRAAAIVEFAVVGSLFILICFAIVELGLVLWTGNALQTTAALTARCAALGAAPCSNAPQFAAATAGSLVFPSVIAASDVTVGQAAGCNGASGNFMVVTINCRLWSTGWLPPPFASTPIIRTECYPINPKPLS